MVDSFDYDYRVDPPSGLTDTGKLHTFRQGTLKKIVSYVDAATETRAETLRTQILAYYNRRSSRQTVSSVKTLPARITSGGVEGGISLGPSTALRFITKAAGGVVLPPTVIYPKEKKALKFLGKKGEKVIRNYVIHPGFTHIGDPISENLNALRQEVQAAVIDSVKDSTIAWVDGMNQETARNLRRQYRYPTPAGRPG